jgi:alpha-tubulin suppressor-like RCC1 family protein
MLHPAFYFFKTPDSRLNIWTISGEIIMGQKKGRVAYSSVLQRIMKARRNLYKTGVAAPRQRAASISSLENAAVCRPPLRSLIQISLLCAALLQALTSVAQPVTKIAGGGYHSLFLKSDGSLWGMGYNYHGQLGDGTWNNTNRPEQIVNSNVTAIGAGGNNTSIGFNYDSHSMILKSDGSMWAAGANRYGQLGDGTYNDTNRPEQIVASNVMAIAAGGEHSLFLKGDGSLWAMGWNQNGQLGDGTYNSANLPEQILASNVTAIAAGELHSLFLKSDGSLWGMGYGAAIGDGTYNNNNHSEQIVASNVTAIAAGDGFSLFLKNDGSLWAMGLNGYGQLGDGNSGFFGQPGGPQFEVKTNRPEQIVASNVTAIAAGDIHSLFLKSDGSLWGMGDSRVGQLGVGTLQIRGTNRPVQIMASGVTAIAAGSAHSLFLKSDGSLWGMGADGYGQLGDGTCNSTNQPEEILAAYNQLSGQLLGGTNMQLSFVGMAGTNYALDRATSLSPPNWIPQLSNLAGSFGALVFTNPPDATTNNFWRIRSVP